MGELINKVKALGWNREEGQGMVEYSLILVLVSIAGIALLTTIGGDIKNVLGAVSNALQLP